MSPRTLAPCAWSLALVLAACAGDPSSTQPEPPATSAAASATASPPAASPPAASPPAASPPAEPEPPPPPANAEPATLRLTAYGRCKYMGVSVVDGHSLLHYRWGDERGFVHRMDEHGRIAQTLPFDEGWRQGPEVRWVEHYFSIDKVAGRWPDQLVLLAGIDYRETEIGHLWRRVGDGWTRVETLDAAMVYEDVWPWHDGSILAWAYPDASAPRLDHRLAVVRGAGKGPSLALLRKRSRCERYDFALRDVQVGDDGRVTALATCGGTWIATWTPDDLEGKVERLTSAEDAPSLRLDARGQGYVLVDGSLQAWDGTSATPVPAPGGRKVSRVFVGRDGEAWILQGSTLSRRAGDGWEPVPAPDGSPVTYVAGLEHGTPWLLHDDGTVSMQTADGAFHAVPLPPTPDLHKVPRATTLRVVGPGDAWIEGTYFKMNKGSKHVGKPFWAAFTTRDSPTAFECGKEPAPADAPSTATPRAQEPTPP